MPSCSVFTSMVWSNEAMPTAVIIPSVHTQLSCLPCLPLFPDLVEFLANAGGGEQTMTMPGGGATLEHL